MTFEDAVADFPLERINDTPPNISYSPWHLLEHIRLAQRDILDFILDPHYHERNWPEDYWPAHGACAGSDDWQRTIDAFLSDRNALETIVLDPKRDLYSALPAGERFTVIREVLLAADHTAYHIGEFGILRQVMGTWPTGHRG